MNSLRASYIALALVLILAGVGVHFHLQSLGDKRDLVGDATWGAMMFCWIGAAAPRARLVTRGAAALAICFVVELSQLWHTPWLDSLRQSVAGHLVLGQGFEPLDFFSYAVGVAAAALVDAAVRR